MDLIGFIRNKFDFKSLADGKVEGWTLVMFVLWWASGVISITRAGSIGYASLNIYFSTWASFFASIYALNQWGGEKDILTLRELTRMSITLPSWWIVFWASIVILGSAGDAARFFDSDDYVFASCATAVGISTITTVVSAFFILSHYEFFQCWEACSSWLTYGGWFELAMSIMVNVWLVIALSQLTEPGAIGSTIVGNGFSPQSEEGGESQQSGAPSSSPTSYYVPGTNIYLASWTAFIASGRVTVKWKEARAIKFAQTSGAKSEEEGGDTEQEGDEEDNDESDKGGA